MANNLKPINYCNPHSRLCPKWVNPMVDALNYYRRNEDLAMLKDRYMTLKAENNNADKQLKLDFEE